MSPTQYGRLHGSRVILKRYQVHVKVTRNIIEYLSATAHLGLTFRKDSKQEDVQLEYDMETYVDADDVPLPVAEVRLCHGSLGRRRAPPYPLQSQNTYI